jgi:hypothetical protein
VERRASVRSAQRVHLPCDSAARTGRGLRIGPHGGLPPRRGPLAPLVAATFLRVSMQCQHKAQRGSATSRCEGTATVEILSTGDAGHQRWLRFCTGCAREMRKRVPGTRVRPIEITFDDVVDYHRHRIIEQS